MAPVELPSADGQAVWETFLSQTWLPALIVADELGLFPALAAAPDGADELAARQSLNRRGMRALLALLASLGYLVVRDGRYQPTDTALHYLLPDSPHYWGGLLAVHRRSSSLSRRLVEVLERPDPPQAIPEPAHTGNFIDGWTGGELRVKAARQMVAYMHAHSVAAAAGLAMNVEFSQAKRLLDVGGCSGCFSVALAHRHPELTCTVADLPPVCEVAKDYLATSGVADRVDTASLDMFRDDWPAGYDTVLLSNIFHDWRPETCAELVRRAYAGLRTGGTINVHEMLLNDDGSGPRLAASFGVLMVMGTQGQQFRFGDLRQLLEDGGFVDVECHSASPQFSLVRARKP